MQFQHESYLAFIDIILVLPGPHRLKIPVLVLGAERKAIFTARAYREEPIIFPGMGRDMMLDSAWQKLVDCDAWVRERQDAGQMRSEA